MSKKHQAALLTAALCAVLAVSACKAAKRVPPPPPPPMLAAAPTYIKVKTCSSGGDCQLCSVAGKAGLEFKYKANSGLKVTVKCDKGTNPRCKDEARIEWQFKGLDNDAYYQAKFEYDPNPQKYTQDATKPWEDVYGPIAVNGRGNFSVLSPSPSADDKTWPYKASLYATSGGKMDLIACADPEIIVDF